MIFTVLVLVGVILFVNGLLVLGKYGGKQVAALNLAVGICIGLSGFYIGFTDALKGVGPTQSFVASASCLVFALTYVLLAAEIFAGTDFKALGWFCFFSGIVMFLISLGFFHILGGTLIYSTQFGVFWFLWAVLFWLFWGSWGLGRSGLVKLTGVYAIFVAFFTGLYPAIAFFNGGLIGW
jgi:putative amide transporter protein